MALHMGSFSEERSELKILVGKKNEWKEKSAEKSREYGLVTCWKRRHSALLGEEKSILCDTK